MERHLGQTGGTNMGASALEFWSGSCVNTWGFGGVGERRKLFRMKMLGLILSSTRDHLRVTISLLRSAASELELLRGCVFKLFWYLQ